ncbi:MAG: VanZ family protein [Nitrospirota bacterium]|nr:VanZ family protein [Nitrospirota bacterium]
MGLIFYLSSRSSFHLPRLPENSDKIIHICLYMPLAYLLFLSLRESGFKKNVFITAVVIAAVYGISDELHQYFVPGRNASAWDALADLTGAFLGSVGASMRKPRD